MMAFTDCIRANQYSRLLQITTSPVVIISSAGNNVACIAYLVLSTYALHVGTASLSLVRVEQMNI